MARILGIVLLKTHYSPSRLTIIYAHMFMGNGFCVPGLINLLSKCDLFLSWGLACVPLAASQKPSPQLFIL